MGRNERGTGFLVNNPNQKKFRGKFYKRKKLARATNSKLEVLFFALYN